jgi:hypothetical protein
MSEREEDLERAQQRLDVVVGAAGAATAVAGLDLGLDLHGDLQVQGVRLKKRFDESSCRSSAERMSAARSRRQLDVVVEANAARTTTTIASLDLGLDLHLRSPETNVSRRGMRRMRDSPAHQRERR